jgi:hypothetical protein
MRDNPSRCHQSTWHRSLQREAMVRWRFEQHMTALQISVLAGCSERVVYEVLQLHRVYYGQFTNHFTRESQQGSSSHPRQWRCWIHTHFVSKLIQHYIYLDELQEQNTTQLRCGRFQRLIRTNNCEVGPFWNFLKTYDCTNYCNAL